MTWYPISERRSSRARKFSWLAMATVELLGGRVEVDGQDFVGGGDLRGNGGDGRGVDVDAFEVDQFESLLGGQGDVEIAFLDVAQVDEDSAQRAALVLLEVEGFGVPARG